MKLEMSAIDPWLPDKTEVRSERFNLLTDNLLAIPGIGGFAVA